jgi:GMP synthase (glutamine-hydrolysing)
MKILTHSCEVYQVIPVHRILGGLTVKKEMVIVLDFGGQYNQLIARRVRECNVYCEVLPYHTSLERIKEIAPKGIIFTGGPSSVYEPDAPACDPEIFSLGIPILGICYGCQLMTYSLGGKVSKAPLREYGKTEISVSTASKLFQGVSEQTICWMSHTDYIEIPASGFTTTAYSNSCPIAAIEDESKNLYGVQFHPEVVHTPEGTKMLHNFLYNVCNCSGDWKMSSFAEEMVASLKEKIGDKKVLCALSGGVDSSVAAVMISKAVGKQLTCIFVDHGLLRKNEGDEVEEIFTTQFDLNFVRVNAQERFYNRLAGVSDPETKRKIIGEEFIRVFEEEAKKIGTVDFLVQGTIYPDVIESGLGKSAVIKSHHNVGGLPDYVDFKEIVEPLRNLFKDEVRKAGLELGIPEKLVYRQPFPGPGLAIRIIGDVSPEKIAILQDADYIYREEIAKAGLDRSIGQYFAVLTNLRSVGVMGDERTYDYTVALRAVTTTDFMTAEFAELPWELLGKISNRIVNEVKHVNRICYDITGKPPATIEWE